MFQTTCTCGRRRNKNTKKCDYLKPISREITQQDDIEIGMLIGANCIKTLKPLEIIFSRNDGPYAYRT